MKKFILATITTFTIIGVISIAFGLYAFIAYDYWLALVVAILGLVVVVLNAISFIGFKVDTPETRHFNLADTTLQEVERFAKRVNITEVKFTDKYLILTYEGI